MKTHFVDAFRMQSMIAREAKAEIMDAVMYAIGDLFYKKDIPEPDKFFYEEIEKRVKNTLEDALRRHSRLMDNDDDD